MTNKEIQARILSDLKQLDITIWYFRRKLKENPYPISKAAVAALARGKFDSKEVGKYGVMKMRDYFNQKEKHDGAIL